MINVFLGVFGVSEFHLGPKNHSNFLDSSVSVPKNMASPSCEEREVDFLRKTDPNLMERVTWEYSF